MRPPNSLEVIKAISINDYLLCLFNHSLSIVILEDNNKVDKRFKIDHPRFLGDYTKRMRKARAQNAGVLPFGSAFFDNSDQICISYYNDSLKIPEIYRYKKNGEFVDTVRLEDVKFVTNRILLACDRRGYFYGVNEKKMRLSDTSINYNKSMRVLLRR
jgi:hypothetical protein